MTTDQVRPIKWMEIDRLIELLQEAQRHEGYMVELQHVTGDLVVMGPDGMVGKIDPASMSFVPGGSRAQSTRQERTRINPNVYNRDFLDRLISRP